MIETGFVDIIKKIADQRGKEIFLETKILKGLLNDYSKGDFKKEIFLLLQIADIGSVNYINRAEDLEQCKHFLVERLEDEKSISPQKSAEMIDLLFLILRDEKLQIEIEEKSETTAKINNQANDIDYDEFKLLRKDYEKNKDLISCLTGIIIPNSVENIEFGVFRYCNSLKEIIVAEDNPKYSAQDGILYNKNKTRFPPPNPLSPLLDRLPNPKRPIIFVS